MKIFLICLLFVSKLAFAQEFTFDIHHNSLVQFIKLEKKQGGKPVTKTSEYISLTSEAQPLVFQRKQKIIPDLLSYYYFKKKDSTLTYILHEWDVNNFDKRDNNKQSVDFEKALIAKYSALEKQITSLYGRPETKGELTHISNANIKKGLTQNDVWRPNDSTEIEMYAVISNYYSKNEMVTTKPTHRIRLYIKNTIKDKLKPPLLSASKVDSLNYVVKSFISYLKMNDFASAKVSLSDVIRDKVTDEQLNLFIKAVSLDKEFRLFYSGIQTGLDGTTFTLLQYQYADDAATPPKELIKFTFDEKDKIIGVQPVKLQQRITQ